MALKRSGADTVAVAADLAALVEESREEILTQWTRDVKSGAYARYADLPLDALESVCRACLDGFVAVLRKGDYSKMNRYVQREVRVRVHQGFRASEIARLLTLFQTIVWPIVTERYTDRPWALSEALARIRNCVDQAVLDLSDSYHLAAQRQADEYLAEMEAMNRRLEELSVRDPLTGLYNRRYFHDRLTHEFHRAKRHGRPLGLLMVDIDHFKHVNDTYGHQAGDQVLRGVALLLVNQTRATDITSRYGGEEFAAVLPETDQDGAMRVAEKLRESIALTPLHRGEAAENGIEPEPIFCTISVGAAVLTAAMPESQLLVRAADAAVYAAKNRGRNQAVEAWTLPGGGIAERTAETA